MDENINNTEESTPMMASASLYATDPIPSYQELVDRAAEIREETEKGANTAERVGSWMADVLAWANNEINSLKGLSKRLFYADSLEGSYGTTSGGGKIYIFMGFSLPVFPNYYLSTRLLVRDGSNLTHDIEISVAREEGKYGVVQLVGEAAGINVYRTSSTNSVYIVVKFSNPGISYKVYSTQRISQSTVSTWTDANPNPQEQADWEKLTPID